MEIMLNYVSKTSGLWNFNEKHKEHHDIDKHLAEQDPLKKTKFL